MQTEEAKILSNNNVKGEYYKIVFNAPAIVKSGILPGQFINVQITGLRDRILRRPFSIYDVEDLSNLAVIYKVVGEGTQVLSELRPGSFCDILGPLGNPYKIPAEDQFPVIVAGGCGAASTYLLAKCCKHKGLLLLGAKTTEDLILVEEYKSIGLEVKVATEDGSSGYHGLVTGLLEEFIEQFRWEKVKYYGSGPNPMIYAASKIILTVGADAQLSLDHEMCCGIGSCYGCVVKIFDPERQYGQGWKYVRSCKEGPVFFASKLYLD